DIGNLGNDPSWKPRSTGPNTSLTVIAPGVFVTSGVPTSSGGGTIIVTDGFGHVVPGANVTFILPYLPPPPNSGCTAGTLTFAPSGGRTDQNGQLVFTVAEPTLQATADYQFTVFVYVSISVRTGTANATIRLLGSSVVSPLGSC